VFGELRSASSGVLTQVVLGSIVMAAGAAVIALSSVSGSEHSRWQEAASREGAQYGVDAAYTQSRIAGENPAAFVRSRSWIDWLIVAVATAIIVWFALQARAPQIALNGGWALLLIAATVVMLGAAGTALWRTTRFN
jgi:hypothetical protein